MFSCRNLLVAAVSMAIAGAAFAQAGGASYPGVGRATTPKELAAWDIDVRPDFKGLPKGSGSVAKGQDVYETKCASCHGMFGDSNEVFNPLVGGTTAADFASGHVARLNDAAFPGRTTLMKVATVSTLWDYINRAMPWTAPKSLSTEEVYAVTAYLLNLGGIVPDNFVLSDQTMADAQKRMPNRNGMSFAHALWPGKLPSGTTSPDVKALACMKDCETGDPKVASRLPAFALNAHGDLAQQSRPVGAQRGMNTASRNAGAAPKAAAAASAPASDAKPAGAEPAALLQKNNCTACHNVDNKLVGPSFREVTAKYAGRADAVSYLAVKIKAGGSGVWGAIPMPAQTLPDPDANAIAQWLAGAAAK